MAGFDAVRVYAALTDNLLLDLARLAYAPVRLFLSSGKTGEDVKALAAALEPAVSRTRRDVYKAAVEMVMERAAEDRIQVEKFPSMRPGYGVSALETALSEANAGGGLDHKRTMGILKRHALAPGRQLIQDLADPAPFDDHLHFMGDPAGFSPDPTKSEDENNLAKQLWADAMSKAERRPVGRRRFKFARILRGERDCAFCVMLATRGAVYDSPADAGAADTFHDSCDCVVVPVFVQDDAAKEAEAQAYKVWRDAQEYAASDDRPGYERQKATANNMMNNLRTYLRHHPEVTVPTLDGL